MTADQSHAVVDRRWVLTSCCGGLFALAGCTGNGDDDQPTDNDDTTTSPTDDNEQETDDQQQEGDVEPEYIEQGTPEIANWNIETQYNEPVDLVDAELTLDQIEISYDIRNADAVNENPEESDQYETDLETTTKLILDQPHLEQPQTKETVTNTVRENHTRNELENGIRENQTIQLPDDIRNYHVETTVREDGEETQHTEQLNFADLYTEARYQHQFAGGAERTRGEATLEDISVENDFIDIEYSTQNEIGDRDVESEINGIIGDYTDIVQITENVYGLEINVEDESGNNHSASIEENLTLEYMDEEGLGDRAERELWGEMRDELYA